MFAAAAAKNGERQRCSHRCRGCRGCRRSRRYLLLSTHTFPLFPSFSSRLGKTHRPLHPGRGLRGRKESKKASYVGEKCNASSGRLCTWFSKGEATTVHGPEPINSKQPCRRSPRKFQKRQSKSPQTRRYRRHIILGHRHILGLLPRRSPHRRTATGSAMAEERAVGARCALTLTGDFAYTRSRATIMQHPGCTMRLW